MQSQPFTVLIYEVSMYLCYPLASEYFVLGDSEPYPLKGGQGSGEVGLKVWRGLSITGRALYSAVCRARIPK